MNYKMDFVLFFCLFFVFFGVEKNLVLLSVWLKLGKWLPCLVRSCTIVLFANGPLWCASLIQNYVVLHLAFLIFMLWDVQ